MFAIAGFLKTQVLFSYPRNVCVCACIFHIHTVLFPSFSFIHTSQSFNVQSTDNFWHPNIKYLSFMRSEVLTAVLLKIAGMSHHAD